MRTIKIKTIIMAIAAFSAMSCGNKNETIIGKQNPVVQNGRLTPEILWSLGQVGNVEVSPNGKKILYSVTYYSIDENKSNTELFTVNIDGSDKKQITNTAVRENSAKWMNDNEHIAFLSNESGSMQLWRMKADGTEREKMTDREGGMTGFLFSPDEKKLLFTADVKVGERTVDIYPDLPKATGMIVNDLMYRHWDEWKETAPHPFVADFRSGGLKNETDLLEGEPYESPMKPFGGTEQLAWSKDSKTIAYTCRKKTGMAYAVSTNSDIYFYNTETGQTTNMTDGMMGYDQNPVFSPDGKWMAWESMERDGYESDKNRLFVMNLHTGEKKDLFANFDQSASSLAWSDNSQYLYFVSCWHGVKQIYRVDVNSGSIRKITEGTHDYVSVCPVGEKVLIGVKQSMSKPNEVYMVDIDSGVAAEISFENKEILSQLQMGKTEARWIQTTDEKQMLVWVVYPPGFDPHKKYPALLYCQGGPQSPVSQFWSTRWNFQLMAANDYIVVAPNRRGVPGFGQEWLEQISGDYGGQNMQDYLSAIDAVAQEAYVDTNRLGCVGASYGGFSVFWLAGHHEQRFKAFIAHDGIFNLEQQYLETEEMWFANWDFKGPYWNREDSVVQNVYANSPHLFVDKWDTPILVIHGEKDYRVPPSQGMAAFNAAILRGIPAELLIYPDENHWVLKPQNSILWQRTFFGWLNKWLK